MSLAKYSRHETALGYCLEKAAQALFSDLTKNRESDVHLPDFSTDRFGLEAKAAFSGMAFRPRVNEFRPHINGGYDAQIKQFQINAFPKQEKPAFYLMGYHGVYDTLSRFYSVRDRKAFMDRNFRILEMGFIDDILVQILFEKGNIDENTRII
jgi:hypothetical protein